MADSEETRIAHEWIKDALPRDRVILEAVVHLIERSLEQEDDHG